MALIPFLKTTKIFPGLLPGTFANAIVPDGHGRAWMSDGINYIKLVSLTDGSISITIDVTGQRPIPICYGPDGNLWVGMTGGIGLVTNQIQVFNLTGSPVAAYALPPDAGMLPYIIKTDGAFLYIFAVGANGAIFRMDTGGNILDTYSYGAGVGIAGMEIGEGTETITVGPTPYMIDNIGPKVYVGNGNNTVSVINSATDTVIATIAAVGAFDLASIGTKMYAADIVGNVVKVIDSTIDTVIATIPVGLAPFWLDSIGTKMYCANSTGNTVSVIDSTTDTVVATVPVGVGPVIVYPLATKMYVGNSDNTVSVIDSTTDTVVATVPVGVGPAYGLAATASKMYVGNSTGNTVSVIDSTTDTVVATVPVGSGPYALAPLGTKIYVANFGDNTVSVIDSATDTVVVTVPVGVGPFWLDSIGTKMYVTNSGDNTVSVIDSATDTVVATLPVGTAPQFMIPVGTKMYVANFGTNTVSDIVTISPIGVWASDSTGSLTQFDNSLSVLQTFPVGTYPSPGASGSVFGPVIGGASLWLSDGVSVVWQLDPNTAALIASWPMNLPAGWTGAGVPMFWDGSRFWVATANLMTDNPTITIVDPAAPATYGPFSPDGFGSADFYGVINLVKGSALGSYQDDTDASMSPFLAMELLFKLDTTFVDTNILPIVLLPFCVKSCN